MARRILVVDDEPMVRALIARALGDAGYEVVAVANGQAALDAARGAEAPFDLIVTNNYMPGLSGAELVAKVRQDFPQLPILHVDDVAQIGSIPGLEELLELVIVQAGFLDGRDDPRILIEY